MVAVIQILGQRPSYPSTLTDTTAIRRKSFFRLDRAIRHVGIFQTYPPHDGYDGYDGFLKVALARAYSISAFIFPGCQISAFVSASSIGCSRDLPMRPGRRASSVNSLHRSLRLRDEGAGGFGADYPYPLWRTAGLSATSAKIRTSGKGWRLCSEK